MGNNFGDFTPVRVGAPPAARISGTVFNDANGDGIQDHHDGGLGGITVTIQKLRDDKPIGQAGVTTTDSNGYYSFTGLVAGAYRVSQTLSADQALTVPAGKSYTIVLAPDQESSGNNFGDFVAAKAYSFTTLDDPHAPAGSFSTLAIGVWGDSIVGYYTDKRNVSHGFIYDERTGVYTTLNAPKAGHAYNTGQGTDAEGIYGDIIVGDYTDKTNQTHGFIYNDRTHAYTTLDDPSAGVYGTQVTGISGNVIVGSFFDFDDVEHGFIYNDATGTYTPLDAPNANQSRFSFLGTWIDGISGNTIVGYYVNHRGVARDFLYNDVTGLFTILRDREALPGGATIYGISGSNIVGFYTDRHGVGHGFIYNDIIGSFTKLDYPNANDQDNFFSGTSVNGIFGDTIVGQYYDNNDNSHGFIAVEAM
jgi:hypothetical protein